MRRPERRRTGFQALAYFAERFICTRNILLDLISLTMCFVASSTRTSSVLVTYCYNEVNFLSSIFESV